MGDRLPLSSPETTNGVTNLPCHPNGHTNRPAASVAWPWPPAWLTLVVPDPTTSTHTASASPSRPELPTQGTELESQQLDIYLLETNLDNAMRSVLQQVHGTSSLEPEVGPVEKEAGATGACVLGQCKSDVILVCSRLSLMLEKPSTTNPNQQPTNSMRWL